LDAPQQSKSTHGSRAGRSALVEPRNGHRVVGAQQEVLAREQDCRNCNQQNHGNQFCFGNNQFLLQL
jgi:hypothetical protein